GIEISAPDRRSPPGTIVLARATNIFGPGASAEMTYYHTPAGAKVFSAGAINFGGSAQFPAVSRMRETLWRRLGRPWRGRRLGASREVGGERVVRLRVRRGGGRGNGERGCREAERAPHHRVLEEAAVEERVQEEDEERRREPDAESSSPRDVVEQAPGRAEEREVRDHADGAELGRHRQRRRVRGVLA